MNIYQPTITGSLLVTGSISLTGTVAFSSYTSAGAVTTSSAASVLGLDSNGNVVTTLPSPPALSIYSKLGSTTKVESPFYSSINTTSLVSPTNFQFHIQAIHVPTSTTLTGVRWYQGTNGVYTGTSGTGVALYTYSAGTITLVASSSNQTIFSSSYGSANAFRTASFTSTYNASPGTYYVAFCWNPSATTTGPSLGTVPQIGLAGGSTYDYTNSAAIAMVRNSLGALPSSQALSGMSGAIQTLYYLALY